MRSRFAAFALLAALAACREEPITHVRVPKAVDRAISEEMPLPKSVGRRGLSWTLPSGWKELPGSGMRLATFTPPGGLKTEATVVAIPGESGGELANVNRWRGQLGLPATDEAGMAASRSTLRTKAGEASVYDLTSAGAKPTRLIAAAVQAGGATWFFKLMGDAAATESARPGFTAIIKGLTPDARR